MCSGNLTNASKKVVTTYLSVRHFRHPSFTVTQDSVGDKKRGKKIRLRKSILHAGLSRASAQAKHSGDAHFLTSNNQ
jgi:hypothetical protein